VVPSFSVHPSSFILYKNVGRFGPAQAEAGATELNLDRITQRSAGYDFNALAFQEAHLVEALNEGGIARDGDHLGTLAGRKIGEGGH
jgi:hypothetical protein